MASTRATRLHVWLFVLYSFFLFSSVSALSFTSEQYTGSAQQLGELKDFIQGKISDRAVKTARAVVAAGIEQAKTYNKFRTENPRRNNYSPRKSEGTNQRRDDEPQSPVFNSTVLAAAALVAEIDAAAEAGNGTLFKDYSEYEKLIGRTPASSNRATSSYWLANKEHIGTWPYGGNSSFKVFRSVTDYGAKGDGVTDDTAAINLAIMDGNRCGSGCLSSSTTGAIVYFPPGTYLVSSTIIALYNTQLVGDPTSVPTIVASYSFVGLGVISTDVYYDGGDGAEWYINTRTDLSAQVCGIHYQVGQATSIQNVIIVASSASGTTQQGIYTENESGGWMSDMVIVGGYYGIYGGNQQFTTSNMNFLNCQIAIQLSWDWGWTWQKLSIYNSFIGISLLNPSGDRGAGSLMLVDSTFNNVAFAIYLAPLIPGAAEGSTGVSLSSVIFTSVSYGIFDTAGTVILPGSVTSVDSFNTGNIYAADFYDKFSASGFSRSIERDPNLLGKGTAAGKPQDEYFWQSMPQYTSQAIGGVIQAKWLAKGDGTTDDTGYLQALLDILQVLGDGYMFYIDAGAYVVQGTLTVHPGTIIVGECWPLLVAQGAAFNDLRMPIPLLQVGEEDEVGSVEIQQLIFTSAGTTAGLIAVEWNILADGQGSAAMWDSHVRLGGSKGSNLQASDCPTSTINTKCMAGSLMMHVTSDASGYFENVWLWTADHDIDDAANAQVNVFVARGILVESTAASWYYGTAVEHATFYQYQFQEASNIVAAMIQTESPYYQPVAGGMMVPFKGTSTINKFMGDPAPGDCWLSGAGCDSSWALRICRSSNITIYGAGLYSWFHQYTQDCISAYNCQNSLFQLDYSYSGIRLNNLVTIGATNMASGYNNVQNQTIVSAPNVDGAVFPFWTLMSYMDGWETAPFSADDLADLEKAYPRFWWKDIVPGGRFDCKGNVERLNIIKESIRMANEMLQDGEREFHDSAFNRFFISPGIPQSGWTYRNYCNEQWYPAWYSLQYWMSALKVLITTKSNKAYRGQNYYITLSCRPFTRPVCTGEYLGQIKGAFYQDGAILEPPGIESITFCPGYFNLRYSNDILRDDPPHTVDELGTYQFDTYERTIMHELTHAYRALGAWNTKQGPSKIIDPENRFANYAKVYGARTASQWAWVYMDPDLRPRPPYPGTSINRDTVITAECYSWMYQNRFWIKRYGWDDDGGPTSWSAPDGSLLIDSGDPAVNISSNPLDETTDNSTAPYCTPAGMNEYGGPLVDCTFPNEPYDDWLLDQGYPCNCDESGCDETSPSCCADNACPLCDCNEDGCTQDSPDCCADSTCQWATTQGTLSNGPLLNVTETGNTTAGANLAARSAKFSARLFLDVNVSIIKA